MTLQLTDFAVSRGSRRVVHVPTLSFSRGSNVLAGANGSGKTSLLSAVAGVVSHTGTARLDDEIVSLKDVGYMPQKPTGAEHLSCLDAVTFARKVAGLPTSEGLGFLAEVDLEAASHQKVGRLSGGQQRLAYLAMVLAQEPRVLLLDEPTAGLDAQHRLRIQDVILALAGSRIVVTATHLPGDLDRLADHVVVLRSGAVAFDGPGDELRARGDWDEVLARLELGAS